TDDAPIPQADLSRALDLQKESIDRIIDPQELQAPPDECAIFDLGARIVKTRTEVRGPAVDRSLIAPPTTQRPVQLDLVIPGEEPSSLAVVGDSEWDKEVFEKTARSGGLIR